MACPISYVRNHSQHHPHDPSSDLVPSPSSLPSSPTNLKSAFITPSIRKNTLYTMKQTKQVGVCGWFPLPTGDVVDIVLIPTMVITALLIIRRNNHIIFAILVLVLVCLHASTNFYFILPGLLLWVYDWSYRVQHALRFKQSIEVESAGNNWYRMKLSGTPRQLPSMIQRPRKGSHHRMLRTRIILWIRTTFA